MTDIPWASLTPDERLASRIERWRNPDLPFVDEQAEAGYKARVDRLAAAFQLRQPDRVPIRLMLGIWPATRAGMTALDTMTDPVRSGEVWLAFNREFPLDCMTAPQMPSSLMLETLDYRPYAWAGHGVAPEAMYQYDEKEWMYPEEYDHLIADPTDYMLSVYVPRTVELSPPSRSSGPSSASSSYLLWPDTRRGGARPSFWPAWRRSPPPPATPSSGTVPWGRSTDS